MKPDFSVRPLQLDDISSAMNLSNAEGWNQTERDWKLFIEDSQNICLAVEHDKKIIGTTTAINYSNQIAWIGMVLVNKDYRGQGISKLLLTDIFEKLKDFKSIKLDATPAGQKVYEKFDFKDEYLIARMTTASVNPLQNEQHELIQRVEEKNIEDIVALDGIVFGTGRFQLINFLIKEYPHKAWQLRRNDVITGFALGRDGSRYHQIGPVVASNDDDAKILIIKALSELNNQPVVVDVLYDKGNLIHWLSSLGFVEQRHFIRMYKKENPLQGDISKQYLVCGPEFG
jgi:GNAT superfamily N-acetyltransferase